jgi:lipoprotein-releasing system ATP-binding protein
MKLEIRNLNKSFVDASRKLTIIEGLSVSLPEKGSVAIIGRSGIGKSTLLHLLAGLETADSGEIIVGDTNLSQLSSDEVSRFRGNNIGVIFQFHHLLPEFSALENVCIPGWISGQSTSKLQSAAVDQVHVELRARTGYDILLSVSRAAWCEHVGNNPGDTSVYCVSSWR